MAHSPNTVTVKVKGQVHALFFFGDSPFSDETPIDAPDDRIHKAPPSAERANFRSATPRGFARAVFEANGRARAAA